MAYFDEELGVVGSNPAYGTIKLFADVPPRQSGFQVDYWQGRVPLTLFSGNRCDSESYLA